MHLFSFRIFRTPFICYHHCCSFCKALFTVFFSLPDLTRSTKTWARFPSLIVISFEFTLINEGPGMGGAGSVYHPDLITRAVMMTMVLMFFSVCFIFFLFFSFLGFFTHSCPVLRRMKEISWWWRWWWKGKPLLLSTLQIFSRGTIFILKVERPREGRMMGALQVSVALLTKDSVIDPFPILAISVVFQCFSVKLFFRE